MSSAKKIGLFACTGVVAGNMMGSGIALLPANLASIGGIAIWGWIISIIGAMSLAYVYARLATKNPQQGGPIAYAGNFLHLVFRQVFFITMLTGLVNLAIGITAVSYLSTFFPVLNDPVRRVSPDCYRLGIYLCKYARWYLGKPFNHYWSGAGSYSCGDDCYCWLALV
ncbi:amino acid permease [Escherichia coli]